MSKRCCGIGESGMGIREQGTGNEGVDGKGKAGRGRMVVRLRPAGSVMRSDLRFRVRS